MTIKLAITSCNDTVRLFQMLLELVPLTDARIAALGTKAIVIGFAAEEDLRVRRVGGFFVRDPLVEGVEAVEACQGVGAGVEEVHAC
jgi:hypothetical protein